MDKYNLKDIEKEVELAKKDLEMDETIDILELEKIEWLIEYAKEKQEEVSRLEDELYSLKESAYQTQQDFLDANGKRNYYGEQNKRYREGIKKVYLSLCKGGKYDGRIRSQEAYNLILDIEKIDEEMKIELENCLEE